MRSIIVLVFLTTIFSTFLAGPVAKPGHAIIKYYKEQKSLRQNADLRHLRLRCENQLLQGFITDTKCEKWLQNGFNSTGKMSSNLWIFSLLFTVISVLIWRPKSVDFIQVPNILRTKTCKKCKYMYTMYTVLKKKVCVI